MSHTITKTLAIAAVVVVILAAIVIPGYLYEIKAEAKTHSLSTSMSTSCNGGTDEPCQTIVCKNDKPCGTVDSNSDQTDIITACKDNKPCGTVDSNSSPPQQTENKTHAELQQPEQPDSSSSDAIPPSQIPDYSGDDDGFD
jgi:hypothetical protein